MKTDFLIAPPTLKQSSESGKNSGVMINSITRRTFIKRSGGATVATLVTWHSFSRLAAANPTTDDGTSEGSDEGSSKTPVKWYLFCKKDPSNDGMEFKGINGKPDGMYQETHTDWEGENAHDGGYRNRTFYYREATPFSGNELAVFIEIRAAGPVQCKRAPDGALSPDEEDLHGMIEIASARLTSGVASPSNWLNYLESAQLNIAATPPAGLHHRDLIGGSLSIDKDGNVTYNPEQVIPQSGGGSFERGLGVDWRVQSLGVVKPKFLIEGIAAAGEEAKIKWNFGIDGENRGAKVVLGMSWENTVATVQRVMQWEIWKAYREVKEDNTLGPIVIVGEATVQNNVEIVAPGSIERPPSTAS